MAIFIGLLLIFCLYGGHIFLSRKLIKEAKQIGLNHWVWFVLCIISGIFFPLISMLLIYPLYAIAAYWKDGKNKQVLNININDRSLRNEIIPDICPHCKNPNTQKMHECEWCGNVLVS